MPDPRVDEQLAEYLEVTRSEREAGYTLPNLFRTIKTVADGLAAHEVECLRYRRATDARLDALELSSRLAEQSRLALLALPPPRPPKPRRRCPTRPRTTRANTRPPERGSSSREAYLVCWT